MEKHYNKLIGEAKPEPLGEDDIRQFIPSAKIIKYSDLKNYQTIDQLLPRKKDFVIILYQNSPNEGHWTILMKDDKYLEYFDSYGNKVDEPLKWISKEENNNLGIMEPYLSKIINNSNYKLNYNKTKFQSDNNHSEISTCGRHCLFRLMCLAEKGHKINEYTQLMKELKKKCKCPYDDIITGFINDLTKQKK